MKQTEEFVFFQPYSSGDPEADRARHALMLEEMGYLKGIKYQTLSEGRYLKSPELTMPGADLLDTIREKKMWEKIKEVSKERGVGIAFDTLKGLAGLAATALMT
ncbi:DUF2513 domain-containing protein [Variovorax atrisoli]|uniref:DUF2513 domain-containing protein n=1 Tax=Variovorax atrisoli TaxID=3394203 RepID=UPI003AAD523E